MRALLTAMASARRVTVLRQAMLDMIQVQAWLQVCNTVWVCTAGIPFGGAIGKELGHGASAADGSIGSARSACHVRRKGGRIERCRRG